MFPSGPLGQPMIDGPLSIAAGTDFVLYCHVPGFPAPHTYIWMTGDGQTRIAEGNIPQLDMRADVGQKQVACFAESDYGRSVDSNPFSMTIEGNT